MQKPLKGENRITFRFLDLQTNSQNNLPTDFSIQAKLEMCINRTTCLSAAAAAALRNSHNPIYTTPTNQLWHTIAQFLLPKLVHCNRFFGPLFRSQPAGMIVYVLYGLWGWSQTAGHCSPPAASKQSAGQSQILPAAFPANP